MEWGLEIYNTLYPYPINATYQIWCFSGSWGRKSCVTGLLHFNARQVIPLLNVRVRGTVNSLVRVPHEIHEYQTPTQNDDSTLSNIFDAIYM